MRVPFVLLLLLRSCCTASRLLGTDPGFCNSLTSTSVQMKGQMLAAVTVSTREGCCAACEKQPGCQMWWLKDASKGFACELYGLDKVGVCVRVRVRVRVCVCAQYLQVSCKQCALHA